MLKEKRAVFEALKRLLKKYEPPLAADLDLEERYDLWTTREVVIDGRKRNGVFFAALIIQSDYVGFYFMPVYTDPQLQESINPELMRKLKGKSCFHLRTLDTAMIKHVEAALQAGFELYQQKNWA